VVHLNGVGASTFFCLHAVAATKVPLVARLNRELSETQAGASLMQRVLETASWTVGVSPQVLKQAREVAPRLAGKSSVIQSGVQVPAQVPGAPPHDPPAILGLGRLVRDKGFDVLLEALPAILERCPSARLTIAGDGPEREPLRRQAAALGLSARVTFTGWVAPDDVPGLMAAATVVVMASRTEGLPMVGLQAAAAGRPVVATRAGGLPAVVQDGETGVLVDLEASALSAAIGRLLGDPAAQARLGRAAWERARALFQLENCADAYAALYRALR
jgi:glycosyltransferase involved in cell wall biosynthesis